MSKFLYVRTTPQNWGDASSYLPYGLIEQGRRSKIGLLIISKFLLVVEISPNKDATDFISLTPETLDFGLILKKLPERSDSFLAWI